jgi:DNA-binding NtrC family response regulator
MKYRIGYVDEDAAQVDRYERKLREYFDLVGYDLPKGTTLENLLEQIYRSEIDLLLVDYLMVNKGILTYNGDQVVRNFEEIRPHFPMIIFTNEEAQAFPNVDNPNIIYDKSLVNNDIKRLVSILTKNIEIYRKFIKTRQEVIANLLIKGESEGGLTAEDKHMLAQNQSELINLDKRSTEVPFQLLDQHKLENLSKVTKDAEQYLESLIKQQDNDTV